MEEMVLELAQERSNRPGVFGTDSSPARGDVRTRRGRDAHRGGSRLRDETGSGGAKAAAQDREAILLLGVGSVKDGKTGLLVGGRAELGRGRRLGFRFQWIGCREDGIFTDYCAQAEEKRLEVVCVLRPVLVNTRNALRQMDRNHTSNHTFVFFEQLFLFFAPAMLFRVEPQIQVGIIQASSPLTTRFEIKRSPTNPTVDHSLLARCSPCCPAGTHQHSNLHGRFTPTTFESVLDPDWITRPSS